MQLNKKKIIRASRISFALTFGFIIATVLNLPHAMWVPITIVVVLFDQYTVGGALQRGIFRVAATIISALVAVFVIYVFHNNDIINNTVIIIGSFIYAYRYMDTKQSYIGILGSVTLAMILSGSEGMDTPLFRSIAIVLGVVVAISAMMIFFPKYAKNHIIILFSNSMSTLENIIKQFIDPQISQDEIINNFLLFEASFVSDVARIARAIDEAKFEVKSKQKIEHYPEAIIHLRRIYRLLGVLLQNIPNNQMRFDQEILEQMGKLANMFYLVQNKLFSRKVNFNDIVLKSYILTIPKASQSHDHNLIFMHCLVQRLMHESNELVTSLSH